jgi:hypothetical protein
VRQGTHPSITRPLRSNPTPTPTRATAPAEPLLTPEVTVKLIQLGQAPATPTIKTMYLIRHGESKWNRAAKRRNVVGLLRQSDHGLTKEGTLFCSGLVFLNGFCCCCVWVWDCALLFRLSLFLVHLKTTYSAIYLIASIYCL